MTELTVCTIVSANYLPYARALGASVREHHPGARFVVLLVDRVEGRFDPDAEPFELIEIERLPTLSDPLPYLFKYTVLEANTAVKPHLLQHLLADGASRLVYLDPDILLFRPMDRVLELLETHGIVLTPHLTAPIDDDRFPDELAIMRSGTYNLGFLAVAAHPSTDRMLDWWRDRIYDRCVSRVEQGLFTDQKWIDLVPGMFPGVAILSDPGHNVAYWNLHSRTVRLGEEIEVNGSPLVFFHFSGIDPDHLDEVSKHQNRFRLGDLGDAAGLFRDYAELLLHHGYRETSGWSYAYANFDDGTPIPEVARDLYRSMDDSRSRFGDPFSVEDGFKAWLNRPYGVPPTNLTRLLRHLWTTQTHFQIAFPHPAGRDLQPYIEWLRRDGERAYGLVDEFIEPVKVGGGTRHRRRLLPRLPSARHLFWTAWGSWPLRTARDIARRWVGEKRWMRMKLRVRGPAAIAASTVSQSQPPAAVELPSGVHVLGYLRTESGVGEMARGLIKALQAADVPLSLTDIDLGVRSRREDSSLETPGKGSDHPFNLMVVNADQVEIVAEHLGPDVFAGRTTIGYWAWEMDVFPDEWLPAFCHLDELWTFSRFCVDVFSSVSPIPVRRVPLPVTVPDGIAADRAEFDLPPDAHVVLSVFDFLSYFDRKNPLALVEAYRRSLGDREDALLLLKASNPDFAPERVEELRAALTGLRVRFIDQTLPREAVWRLIACCDVYASLHRAEGFGLPLLESMALGKPVLATAYSGNVDFMNPANSLPVGYRMVPVSRPEGPYTPGMMWADADVDHAAELLRTVYEDRELATRLGAAARAYVDEHHTPEAVARIVRQRLSHLLRSTPSAAAVPSPRWRM
jgi:glycosyltransferase involved in cell wall biosynthesis